MTVKAYLGLGTNEGNRKINLELAISRIKNLKDASHFRVSPIYETPALLPEGAPDAWNKPYLNLVLEARFPGTADELLLALKQIERDLGRGSLERWAPRTIDIDLLLWGNDQLNSPKLQVPHARMLERAFVLDPLKDLDPTLLLPIGEGAVALTASRRQPQHAPLWMGILNITPDSFSDGGSYGDPGSLEKRLDEWDAHFVGVLDVGAESTRPGARPVEHDEEWQRLAPALRSLQERYKNCALRPLISVDTRCAKTAARALEYGVDIINDVSGLADTEMIDVLRGSEAQYVLMHSLSVPAEPTKTLPKDIDPIAELLHWFKEKTAILEAAGISKSRILLDPGIGFGKTSLQSLEILRGFDKLTALPYRLLAGHSRKSFLNPFTPYPAQNRDLESAGVSINLVSKGVDVIRVHDPVTHIRTFRAWNHVNRSQP